MKGSANYQVHMLFKKSGINAIGTSKHAAKAAAREFITTAGFRGSRSATWHEIGKQLGVHSYATADAYRDTWRHILQHAKEKFHVKDIEKLTSEHIASYLKTKVDQGVAHATFMQYAAAAEKLETALNMYSERFTRGKTYDFSSAIKPLRQSASKTLQHFSGHREYLHPEKIVDNMKNPVYKTIAELQYRAGLRVKETNMIRSSQLLPDNRFKVEGGKGGKIRIIDLPSDLHQKLEKLVNESGDRLEFKENSYRQALKEACASAGEEYTGTHGLRWTYAQNQFQEYQLQGETYEQAEQHISNDLGHNRADITQHYLGH